MATYLYIINERSREVHRVIMSDGKRFSMEECNLDDILSENLEEVDDPEPFLIGGGSECGHCWPEEPVA